MSVLGQTAKSVLKRRNSAHCVSPDIRQNDYQRYRIARSRSWGVETPLAAVGKFRQGRSGLERFQAKCVRFAVRKARQNKYIGHIRRPGVRRICSGPDARQMAVSSPLHLVFVWRADGEAGALRHRQKPYCRAGRQRRRSHRFGAVQPDGLARQRRGACRR